MQVGEHEAIHDVGINPSTMNSGAQTIAAAKLTHNSLRNSSGHIKLKPTRQRCARNLLAHKVCLLHYGSTSIFPISRLSEQRNEMKSIHSHHDRIGARSVVQQHRKSHGPKEPERTLMNALCS